MFDKIRELWSKKSLLDVSTSECREMLQLDLLMFSEARKTLQQKDSSEVNLDIYKHDKKVNKLERSVRKKILTHLTVGGRTDLNQGLILISVVIDLERIGDYIKNLYELALLRNEKINPGPWKDEIGKIEIDVEKTFNTLIDLFAMSDPDTDVAKELMINLGDSNKMFDENISEIIKGRIPDLTPSDAAVLVLYMRYLKRISCHLRNVASGIVNPMHRIGFKAKPEKTNENNSE